MVTCTVRHIVGFHPEYDPTAKYIVTVYTVLRYRLRENKDVDIYTVYIVCTGTAVTPCHSIDREPLIFSKGFVSRDHNLTLSSSLYAECSIWPDPAGNTGGQIGDNTSQITLLVEDHRFTIVDSNFSYVVE